MRGQSSRAPESDRLTTVRRELRNLDPHAVVTACERPESRCRVPLDLPAIVIDCDVSILFGGGDAQEKRGDFVIGLERQSDGVWVWILIEMKRGTLEPAHVHGQLQALAYRLSQLTNMPKPAPPAVDFLPVVLKSRSRLNPSDQRGLNSRKILCNGVKRSIVAKACGTPVSASLESTGTVQRRQR